MKKNAWLNINEREEVELNRFLLPLIFIVCSLLLEVQQFAIFGFKYSNGGNQLLPFNILFDFGGMLIIAGFIFWAKTKKSMRAIFFTFISLQILLNVANSNIYFIFGDLFTIDYVMLSAEAAAAFDFDFIDFRSIGIYALYLAAIITGVVLLYKYNKLRFYCKKSAVYICGLALLFIIELVGVSMYEYSVRRVSSSESQSVTSESTQWEDFSLKSYAYQQFGYYGFYAKTFYNTICKTVGMTDEEEKEIRTAIEDGQTTQAELDNRLAGDNVILILCESLDTMAIDPVFTPFMYSLMNGDACNFTNFHASNKTNVSENIAIIGNSGKKTTLSSLVKSGSYDYAYTLPKLYEQAHPDAVTTYLHSFTAGFYGRKSYMSNEGFGFNNTYFLHNYETDEKIKFNNWGREEKFVEYFADELVPDVGEDGHFLTTYATVSMHGSWNRTKTNFTDLYEEYDESYESYKEYMLEAWDIDISAFDRRTRRQLRNYKVGTIDFDRAIEKLFSILEEKGHLDDTTVVLYGDHNAYYHNLCYNVKQIEKDDYTNIEAYNIPLVIYNSKLDNGNYDQFCNTYDIFPTICELHGLEYNKSLVKGYNLFSDDIKDSLFVSHMVDKIFNQNCYTQNVVDITVLGEYVTEEEVQRFRQLTEDFYKWQSMIEKVLYFNMAS